MSQHTPGPWEVVANDGAYVKRNELAAIRIEDRSTPHEMVLALVTTDCGLLTGDEGTPLDSSPAMANARLIAAAPDLLAAIEGLLRSVEADEVGVPSCSSIRIARAAIAKAEGGDA